MIDYALSLLNRDKMRLVKSISYWKNEVDYQESWLIGFMKANKFADEARYQKDLKNGKKYLTECKNRLTEKKRQLLSINTAIATLKKPENIKGAKEGKPK